MSAEDEPIEATNRRERQAVIDVQNAIEKRRC
jgi:hypothetical protein